MKRVCSVFLCFLVIFAGCTVEFGGSPPGEVFVNGGDLLPANACSMTVSYNNYVGNAPEPDLKSYQADERQFQQFCDFIKSAKILQLSDNDVLAFSNLAYANAADISVNFDTGDSLYLYTQGGISRFTDKERAGLPAPECYFVSHDSIHQLQKILIPDFEKDFQALTMEPGYVKAKDVKAESVHEIPLFMPQGRKIFTVSEGFIAFSRVWGGSNADSFLRAVKYDERGNFLWMQNYSDIKLEQAWYGLSDCIETADGGFVFVVNEDYWFQTPQSWVPGEREEVVLSPGRLLKCNSGGDVVWENRLDFVGSDGDTRIFEVGDRDILTVETCQSDDGAHYKTGDSTHGYTDLLFTKYDKSGKRTELKKYGGSDFDSLSGACYSPDAGLIIWGSTQSCDGDITGRKEKGTMLYPREFLVVFDNDFNEKWQYVFEQQNEINTAYAVTVDNQIYVAGSLSKDTGKHNQTAVFKFSNDGAVVKSKTIDAAAVMGICAVADDTVFVWVNPSAYSGNSGTPQIYRLDANLEVKKTIKDTAGNGFDYKVIPTYDNGFFTVLIQCVKYLPQPLWQNRSMTDSATILSRYDAAGKLLCRKTYDKNQTVEDVDIVIPLPDGRVIVGR